MTSPHANPPLKGWPGRAAMKRRRAISDAKKPNHIDRHIGRRIRLCRAWHNLSQDELAQMLNVAAQQVQKYEVGETRVSAARLFAIAQQLQVPMTWFFEELDAGAVKPTSPKPPEHASINDGMDLCRLMARREARDIVEAYFSIPGERLRKKLLQMASLLSGDVES